MPTYEYACPKCEHRFELFHSIKDDSVKRCPECKARAKRVPAGGAGLLFKGSGFYITDYRSPSYKDAAKKESGSGKTSEAAPKDKPKDAKRDTKKDSPAGGGAGRASNG